MGAFFVPISFLIFSYAVTAHNLSRLNILLLSLASISSYFAWLIFYLRTNRSNEVYIRQMKKIEKELEDLKIEFQPLTKTDVQRKGWLAYEFPEYVFGFLWILLILLWLILSTEVICVLSV